MFSGVTFATDSMMSKNDKDNKRTMKRKPNEMDTKKERMEDDIFFAPLDQIRTIENIIVNLETVCRELYRVAEGMKPVEIESCKE